MVAGRNDETPTSARRHVRPALIVVLAIATTFAVERAISPTQDSGQTTEAHGASSSADGAVLSPSQEETPRPDHPGEWAAWRTSFHVDENGEIPHNALIEAKAAADALPAAEAAGITPGGWTWIGPGNVGGRVRTIAIHPTQHNRMWIGSVSGGIWMTDDGGNSWSPADDFLASLAVTSIVIDPTNADRLLAATGEGFFNEDAVRGAGVFESLDGGTTWNQVPGTDTPNFYWVNRLAFSSDGATVLAATNSGIWRWHLGTWTRTTFNRTLDVKFSPTDPARAIAGRGGGAVLRSTNGGVSWVLSTGIPSPGTDHRTEVAYSTANPSVIYASKAAKDANGVWGTVGIYRSTDGGANFTARNTTTAYLGQQGWYDNAITVLPFDASGNPSSDCIVVGGIDLWRSTNGGQTLTRFSRWEEAPLSAHADHHAVVVHPGFNGNTNAIVLFGNDGGIYRAQNVFTTGNNSTMTSGWTALNNGLGITQFYGASGHAPTGRIIGGTQDNGTIRYTPSNGANAWDTMFGGDGGYCASDPQNASYHYGEYIYLQLVRSSNGGSSAQYICGRRWNGSAWVWKAPPYLIPDAQNGDSNFIAPLVLDPNNSNRIIAGGASLWRTNNCKATNTASSGPAWTSIKPPVSSSVADGHLISAIAIAPTSSTVVWVGYNDGRLESTLNGTVATPTWTRRDNNPTALPDRRITRITIDPSNAQRVLITLSGFQPNNLWETTDGGVSWHSITGTGTTALPEAPLRDVEISPANPSWLYVASELGVFTSENNGGTWNTTNDGPANVAVDELVWMSGSLHAVTHGRGIFKQTPSAALTLTFTTSGGGVGDADVSLTNLPSGTTEGFTLFSLNTSLPAGTGPVYGIVPDIATIRCLLTPAAAGNVYHWLTSGVGFYPHSPIQAPAGSLVSLAGMTVDGVALAFGGTNNYALLGQSNVVRITF